MSTQTAPPAKPAIRYREHWHEIFVHFPISLFGVAFLFQILHLFPTRLAGCFEVSTNVTLIAGTLSMIPATLTGWAEWKTRYKGARVLVFKRKIPLAFSMMGFSIVLTVWRTVFLPAFENVPYSPAHWIYIAGNTFLVLGAVAEGYFGGRLSHH